MSQAFFGPAGNSDSFKEKYKSFSDVPKYAAEMGLNAFEYQFGRGVRMSDENAAVLKEECRIYGIEMSAHAPYYISLASVDEEKRMNSIRYMLETAKALRAMGGTRMVVHSGSVGTFSREEAIAIAANTLKKGIDALDQAGYSDLVVCPETMGKIGQLGSLDEVMKLSAVDERVIPCIDFGHLNARSGGGIKGKDDYAAILKTMENAVGQARLKIFHSHFSKIEYTSGGEKRHLTFSDTVFGPDPEPLLELVAEMKLTPHFICESDGTQAEDAREMRRIYLSLAE